MGRKHKGPPAGHHGHPGPGGSATAPGFQHRSIAATPSNNFSPVPPHGQTHHGHPSSHGAPIVMPSASVGRRFATLLQPPNVQDGVQQEARHQGPVSVNRNDQPRGAGMIGIARQIPRPTTTGNRFAGMLLSTAASTSTAEPRTQPTAPVLPINTRTLSGLAIGNIQLQTSPHCWTEAPAGRDATRPREGSASARAIPENTPASTTTGQTVLHPDLGSAGPVAGASAVVPGGANNVNHVEGGARDQASITTAATEPAQMREMATQTGEGDDPESEPDKTYAAKRQPPTKTQKIFFTWKHKNQIGDGAFQELMHIIRDGHIVIDELPFSATTLKAYSDFLPLQKLYTHRVKQLVSKGFSNTRSRYTNMYTFSIEASLQRMLSNKEIYDQASFGPGVKLSNNKKATEVWHGELVRGSVVAVPQLYPQKSSTDDYVHPGGCYRSDIRNPFIERSSLPIVTRVTGLFIFDSGGRKMTVDSTYDREELWVSVQPVITKESELRLFGLRESSELFDFSDPRTCYLLNREYDMKLSRLGRKVDIYFDRSQHDLDEVLPPDDKPPPKPRKKRAAPKRKKGPTKGKGASNPTKNANSNSGGTKRKRQTQQRPSASAKRSKTAGLGSKKAPVAVDENASTMTARATRATTRSQLRQESVATSRDTSDHNTTGDRRASVEDSEEDYQDGEGSVAGDEIDESEYESDQQAPPEALVLEIETALPRLTQAQLLELGFEPPAFEGEDIEMDDGIDEGHISEEDPDEDYISHVRGIMQIPIVSDETVDESAAEGVVRLLIIPEKGSIFDNDLFVRELTVVTEQNQDQIYNRSLRRDDIRLKSKYEKDSGIITKVVRLIHCGHLRETLCELEMRRKEFTWDELEKSKRGELPTRVGLMMDFYCDKFGVFRTTHRSSGGLYTTLLNLNYRGRDQPRNHSCVGFIPNGTSFQGGAIQILREFGELAKGKRMQIQGKEFIVHVKLMSTTSDMAEANELAGVNNSQSNTCCRFCFAPRTVTGDEGAFLKDNWIRVVLERNVHLCERFRREKDDKSLNKLGLVRRRPVLETCGPAFDPFIQIPVDISHSEQKGIGMLSIKNMMERIFSTAGKEEFTRRFTEHSFPTNVSRMVNPTFHHKRLHMHEVTTLLASMPFILKKMDTSLNIFRPSIFDKYTDRYPEIGRTWTTEDVMNYMVELHISMARSNMYCFKREMGEEDYTGLQEALFESRRLLHEFYAPFEKTGPAIRRSANGREFIYDKVGGTIRHLPNYHQADHMQASARRYGTLLNVSCSIGELVHKLFKQLVPHTNYMDMEKSFCRYWNIMDTLRHIIDCVPDHPWYDDMVNLRKSIPSLMSGYFFGQIARFSEEGAWVQNSKGQAAKLTLMKDPRFPDLFFGARIKDGDANLQFPTKLYGRGLDDEVIRGLVMAYESYGLHQGDLILTKDFSVREIDAEGVVKRRVLAKAKLKWWESLSYYDTTKESSQRIRRGDILSISEKAAAKARKFTDFTDAYGKLLGICTHNNKGTNYVFCYIEWMSPKWRIDQRTDPNMGDLKIYDLIPMETADRRKWTSFIALTSLSDKKTPYFVPIGEDPRTGIRSFHLNVWFTKSV
ncbi:hypothetical protein BJ508DRAFT_334297 [Ascobolus immersus RN42]|uniref:BAH domain-containing protein n=1 Tax=Ascobolus immersus RN42 TaxID=1160509 RepID=A0A3N4HU23_ASCIM|nr:hypothetical protein BJ508DRAFT_334297 [Ascobolus immersus RN42]